MLGTATEDHRTDQQAHGSGPAVGLLHEEAEEEDRQDSRRDEALELLDEGEDPAESGIAQEGCHQAPDIFTRH